MGAIGYGYGSECHLLRFMGRHRHELDKRIVAVIDGDSIDWRDFDFHPTKPWPDAEIKGLDFLEPDNSARVVWKEWWPRGRGIAKLLMEIARDWVLSQGVQVIELHVWEANVVACRFYESLGFKSIQRRMVWKR
jgi:GNAT superfamily N-acetyltransferase